MKKIAAIAAVSASALAMSVPASFADYTLNILHINDWHSRIESNNKFESTCSVEEEGKGECIGGAARLVTAIDQERQKLQGQNVVLLERRRQFPGVAVLHHLQGHGRSRIPEPHEVRRHDARQS